MKELIKRKLAGRTQRWLCTMVGMTDVELSNSLSGFRDFKPEEISKICRVLSISKKEINDLPQHTKLR